MNSASKKAKFPIFRSLLVLILGLGIWQSWFWWQRVNAPVLGAKGTNISAKPTQFTVSSGTPGQQIGRELAKAGLISSTDAWKLWVWWRQKQDPQGGFKAGTYLISPQDSLATIADKIWRGELMQTTFTIPEGWSIREMANYFESIGYFSADDFVAAASKIDYDKYPWLPANLPHLEGFLYPDTYKITSDRINNPQAIIEVMLTQFQQDALPVYQQAQTQLSLMEWVTLASIVEKESVVGEERRLIAGVFTSRLQRGMRLESDPTVEYALGIKQTADRPLTYKQVGTPAPHNTYVNTGLPPTPIASPGLASLKATLNPESTDYLFFVARYDGTHVFSKTLAEHVAATKRIRRERQQRN
ncbi:MAG: endolytic transglycosylase MltG [Xenococcaceae cyanobacterium MO_188.B32]|nr:endolytic transglycosylase MltG [Xenococcaceae cyanobacterium MO_188.B32]